MLSPAIARQLTIFVVCAAIIVVAIFVGWDIGSSAYPELILGSVICLGVFITFFLGDFFWVLAIASSFLTGTFPILRGSFTPFHIMMAIGVAKFVVEDVVLRRAPIKFGRRFDFWMIAGFMGVMTLHGIHDRFGMRFLGSSVWGGRNYVNVYVGLAAFFVIQSLRMPAETWKKLPYLILGVTSFDLLIAVITTIFPSSIYKIYPFYSGVSLTGFEEIVYGESDITGRVGAFGSFGFVLILLVLASVPLQQILHPGNFWRLCCLIVGWAAVLFSGFRSWVANTMFGFLSAGIRDLRYGVLVLLPFLAAILFSLSVINSEFFHLPKQIQRAISFVPGHWDYEMAHDAASSNDFRRRTWTLWEHQYFRAHPWLGRGFGFRSEWVRKSVYNSRAVDFQQEVELGNIHNGFLASLDALGVIGTFFFIVWCLRLLHRTFRVRFYQKGALSTALRFLALYLAVSILSYWMGANTIGSFLPQVFALGGVFARLQQEIAMERESTTAPKSTLEGTRRRQQLARA